MPIKNKMRSNDIDAADSLKSIITSVAIAYNAATNGKDDVEGEAVDISCCASCGKAEVDEIKLMKCDRWLRSREILQR